MIKDAVSWWLVMEHLYNNNIYILTKSEGLFNIINGLIGFSLPGYKVYKIESLYEIEYLQCEGSLLIVDSKKLEKNKCELSSILIKWLVINTEKRDDSDTYWLEQGSFGELYESESLENITKAIKTINNNELWFSRKVLSIALSKIKKEKAVSNKSKGLDLTKKEIKVFNLLLDGMTNNQIAETCHVSINTIKTHVSNVISKSNVNTRKELMAKYTKVEELY